MNGDGDGDGDGDIQKNRLNAFSITRAKCPCPIFIITALLGIETGQWLHTWAEDGFFLFALLFALARSPVSGNRRT